MKSALQVFAILLFLVLLAVVPNGCTPGTISCFVCSSRNGSYTECEDPFNAGVSTYVDRCKVPRRGHIGEFPAHFCIKIIGVSYTTQENIVIRRCTTETMDKQCGQFRLGDDLLKGCILTCDLDGCNSSSFLQHSQHLLFTMMGLFFFLGMTSSSIFATTNYHSSPSLSSNILLTTTEQTDDGIVVQIPLRLQQLTDYKEKSSCDKC